MKFLFILYIFLFSISCYTQNLVPNPSFEQHDTCPDNENQVHYAIGWKNFCLTPDYYNACSTTQYVSVPSWGCGFQYPATGNSYVGLATFWYYPTIPLEYVNVREYIGIRPILS